VPRQPQFGCSKAISTTYSAGRGGSPQIRLQPLSSVPCDNLRRFRGGHIVAESLIEQDFEFAGEAANRPKRGGSTVCRFQVSGISQKGMSSSEISADWLKSSCAAGWRWSALFEEPDWRLYPPEPDPLSSRPDKREMSFTRISVR
jgi:hypothetical protein